MSETVLETVIREMNSRPRYTCGSCGYEDCRGWSRKPLIETDVTQHEAICTYCGRVVKDSDFDEVRRLFELKPDDTAFRERIAEVLSYFWDCAEGAALGGVDKCAGTRSNTWSSAADVLSAALYKQGEDWKEVKQRR